MGDMMQKPRDSRGRKRKKNLYFPISRIILKRTKTINNGKGQDGEKGQKWREVVVWADGKNPSMSWRT